MRKASTALLFLAVSALTLDVVHAGFLKNVVKVISAPVRVPAQVTIQIIRRDDPLEPVKDTARTSGVIITQTSDELGKVANLVYKTSREAIGSTLGGDWPKAFDALSAQQRVTWEIARTSGRFLGKCLQGHKCTIQELTAMPVAASMRDAYNVYRGYGVPLSEDVKRVLSKAVAARFLDDIRVVYGARPDFTIPGFLNTGYKLAGKSHAVTLANLIIFSEAPDLKSRNDWHWLLHELKHSDQYKNYSLDPLEAIDGFAVEYVSNWKQMESEADRVASERLAILDKACGGDEANC